MYTTMHVAGNELFYTRRYQEEAAHYTEAVNKNPNEPAVRIWLTVIKLYILSEGTFSSFVKFGSPFKLDEPLNIINSVT